MQCGADSRLTRARELQLRQRAMQERVVAEPGQLTRSDASVLVQSNLQTRERQRRLQRKSGLRCSLKIVALNRQNDVALCRTVTRKHTEDHWMVESPSRE